MKKVILFCFIGMMFVPVMVRADLVTHTFGNTGYMIREAMQEKANKRDPDNYWQAVKLQKEAKKYFHGTHKKGRNITKAMELTKEAYQFAKTARDSAVKQKKYYEK